MWDAARGRYVDYEDDDDDAPICPECEANMLLIADTQDPLYQCSNCGLEQYESNLAAFWEREVAEEEGLLG